MRISLPSYSISFDDLIYSDISANNNNRGESVSYEDFADGFLQDKLGLGRPVDLMILQDGSMFVSDDQSDRIYRITYQQ